MVVAAYSDGKPFYTAVDGGSIRKYPINVDDLTQITDEVFTLKIPELYQIRSMIL
jgi:hypothetical protein